MLEVQLGDKVQGLVLLLHQEASEMELRSYRWTDVVIQVIIGTS
jgi:hypothetical protein